MGIDIGELDHWRAFWTAASKAFREAQARREDSAGEWVDTYVASKRYGAGHIEEPTDWEASGW